MKVLLINGPNLKYLGKREPEIYGDSTFKEIEADLKDYTKSLGHQIESIVSNSEGEIVTAICEKEYDALVINPGAYTHYSIAIMDAMKYARGLDKFVAEVHLTNVFEREDFRHEMLTTKEADIVLMGGGVFSYFNAISTAAAFLNKNLF